MEAQQKSPSTFSPKGSFLKKVEVTGFEPAADFVPTASPVMTSVNGPSACVANALQCDGTCCPFVTSLSEDLRKVISSWNRLPCATREEILRLTAAGTRAVGRAAEID